MPIFREEVINVQFAELLREYGLEANPETIVKHGRPDVIIIMGGLKLIIEGRFGNKESLRQDVKNRVEEGMADISMGIFYTKNLREAKDTIEMKNLIMIGVFDGVVCYFEQKGLELKEFQNMNIDNIVETINNIFHLYVKNDLIREHVKKVEKAIEEVTDKASSVGLFFQSDVLIKRLNKTLGLKDEDSEKS